MNQNDEYEEIKKTYLAGLTSSSKIKNTQAMLTHLDNFLSENKLTFTDLPNNIDSFRIYLQNRVGKQTFRIYWSYFKTFYSWLESEYLKPESVSKESTTRESLNLELVLHAILGGELCARHLTLLESEKRQGETLEDVFRRFIQYRGVQITKEEWLERVREGEKVDHFKILEPMPCPRNYRAINAKGEWFCDGKKIDPAVCINRQQRFQAMGKRCYPQHRAKDFQKPKQTKREPADYPRDRRVFTYPGDAWMPSGAWSRD